MNRFRALLLALFCVLSISAQQRSQTIVFINGQRFYVHHVGSGETLYSLAKMYDVEVDDIVDNNQNIKQEGLKSDESIKIPINSPTQELVKKEMDRKLRKSFDIHTVSRGETLYAISRRYEISVATIVEDNPNLDPSRLALGQEILIRKKEIGQSSEGEAMEQMREYTSEMNRVAPKGYEYYVVPPRETLYSLLRLAGMSRNEFFEMNQDHSGELRAGEILLIRSTSVDDDDQESLAQQDVIDFRALAAGETLRVSLLLPLTTPTGGVVSIFEEFYQGFLLGCEELKRRGRSVEVTLYDTQRDSLAVAKIAKSEAFQTSNLIVGPVYEELLSGVLPIAERGSIPVVSPLATLQSSSSGVLFQMAPAPRHRYDKIGDLISDDVRVTLIYSENIDSKYEAEVKQMLRGREYTTHTYEYEHPSVISERIRDARREEREEELEPSPSDLSPLIAGDTLTTFFILSDNETDVDRILSALVSADSGLRSRSQGVCNFTVVNNPQWNRYSNIDRAMLFRAHVTSFSSYHARRDSRTIREFDSQYVQAFGVLPTLYSYRGYDVARIFGDGLYSDIEYNMEGRTFTPLQTTYRFLKDSNQNFRVNQNWMRVNYLPNYTITLE